MCVAIKLRLTTVDKNQNFFFLNQYEIYDSDIPVTLKYGQSHQAWYEVLDPAQGYNMQCLKDLSVSQKAIVTVFVKPENTSVISIEFVQR